MSNIFDLCLIGLGPSGIGFLSSLDNDILCNSICIEKGATNSVCNCHRDIKSLCSQCNHCGIVSGLGGASRFSCGKISNFPAGSGLEMFFESRKTMIDFMNLEIERLKTSLNLIEFAVPNNIRESMKSYFEDNNILFKYYDVYEFKKEKYIQYLTGIMESAKESGLKVLFNTEVTSIEENKEDKTYCVKIKCNNVIKEILAKKVVIATGNINCDVLIANSLISKSAYTYEIGLRITVPTNKISNYLSCHGDLKLKYKNGRTYCVSKNGFVIAYSNDDLLLLEGYADDEFPTDKTNFAIIFKYDKIESLGYFKSKYKNSFNGIPVKQKYTDYLNNIDSNVLYEEKYIPVQRGNIRDLFNDELNSSIIDFIDSVLINTLMLNPDDILLYAPELKTTPCINIDSNFKISNNLYLIGAATGKFRGILQSICSGIRCAKLIGR